MWGPIDPVAQWDRILKSLPFHRDKAEELVELTDEQRNELMKKESSRLQKTGHRVTYSPRKEKALKIYLDGATNKDAAQD